VNVATVKGKVTGAGSAGMAVAHYGSNNMIAFRYKLKTVPMKIADKSFTADGVEFPAGSFVIGAGADMAAVKAAVEQFGLTAASLSGCPPCRCTTETCRAWPSIRPGTTRRKSAGTAMPSISSDPVRSDLQGTREAGEPPRRLRRDRDADAAGQPRGGVRGAAARPVPYMKTDKYKFLGDYGSLADITGGNGRRRASTPLRSSSKAAARLICTGGPFQFPTRLGMARTVDASDQTSSNSMRRGR
jgi:hypothetical protein